MLVNNIQYSYLKNGAWNAFSGTSETAMDGIKIQTPKAVRIFYATAHGIRANPIGIPA